MATSKANKGKVNQRRDQVLNSVKKVNCMVLDLTENLIEGTISTGSKYQRLAASAIKKSEPIIEKQVDMIFDTVEIAMDQIENNSKRFQKLLGITKQVKSAKTRLNKLAKRVSVKVETGIDEAEKAIESTLKQGRKQAKSTIKGVKAEVKRTSRTIKSEVKKTTPKRTKRTTRKTTATK